MSDTTKETTPTEIKQRTLFYDTKTGDTLFAHGETKLLATLMDGETNPIVIVLANATKPVTNLTDSRLTVVTKKWFIEQINSGRIKLIGRNFEVKSAKVDPSNGHLELVEKA